MYVALLHGEVVGGGWWAEAACLWYPVHLAIRFSFPGYFLGLAGSGDGGAEGFLAFNIFVILFCNLVTIPCNIILGSFNNGDAIFFENSYTSFSPH